MQASEENQEVIEAAVAKLESEIEARENAEIERAEALAKAAYVLMGAI